MANLIWKCRDCDFTTEGTSSGWGYALSHKKNEGRGHTVVLVNQDNGEEVLGDDNRPITNLSKAQKLRYIGKKEKIKDERRNGTGTTRGQIKPEIVDLDPRLRFMYEWDRMVTGWDGSFSDWIWEVILDYHIQNRERLRFDILFREAER